MLNLLATVLVAKCYDLINQHSAVKDDHSGVDSGKLIDNNPLSALKDKQTITYDDLFLTAKGRQWNNDLRLFPETNFHQLTKYLIKRTRKYGEYQLKGFVYKKMRAYQFFEDGNISEYQIAKGFDLTWVRAIAFMRHIKYKVIGIFNNTGDILHAACECPAG